MAITAGCYSLNILCDTLHQRGTTMQEYRLAGEKTFIGQTAKACERYARKQGWKFTKDGKHYCPTCAALAKSRKRAKGAK